MRQKTMTACPVRIWASGGPEPQRHLDHPVELLGQIAEVAVTICVVEGIQASVCPEDIGDVAYRRYPHAPIGAGIGCLMTQPSDPVDDDRGRVGLDSPVAGVGTRSVVCRGAGHGVENDLRALVLQRT